MKTAHRLALRTVRYGLVRAVSTAFAAVYQAIDLLASDAQREFEQLAREDHEQRKATCACFVCAMRRQTAPPTTPAATKGAN